MATISAPPPLPRRLLLPALALAAALALAVPPALALTVKVPGRCPDKCSLDISSVFESCVPARYLGCTMKFCAPPGAGRAVQCGLKPGVPSRIYPGETLLLRAAYASSRHTFAVDLGGKKAIGGGVLQHTKTKKKTKTKTDIYFLADATGSMDGILASVKKHFLQFAAEQEALSDAAYGVGIFRDERELAGPDGAGFRNIQPVTKSLDKARGALTKFAAEGGLDTPEGNLAALFHVATRPRTVGWRPGARRVVLYIGDNPGHEPSCVSGVPGPITRARVIAALNRQRIAVVALSFAPPGLDGTPTALGCSASGPAPPGKEGMRGQARDIARGTGGALIKGYASTFNVRAVVEAVKRLSREVAVASNSCAPHVKVSFAKALPQFLPADATIAVTVSPEQSLCKKKQPFYTCAIVFRQSGVLLPRVEIKFNYLQCPAAA